MRTTQVRTRTILAQLLNLLRDDEVRRLLRAALRAFKRLHAPLEEVTELTYEQTVRYFVEQRPDDVTIVKGAVLLQPLRQGRLTVWLYLDANNEMVCREDGTPYGRKLLVRHLDEELEEAFGGTELLILE